MADVLLVVTIVAFFALAALLVNVLGRMIDSSGIDVDYEESEPEEPAAGLPLTSGEQQ